MPPRRYQPAQLAAAVIFGALVALVVSFVSPHLAATALRLPIGFSSMASTAPKLSRRGNEIAGCFLANQGKTVV